MITMVKIYVSCVNAISECGKWDCKKGSTFSHLKDINRNERD